MHTTEVTTLDEKPRSPRKPTKKQFREIYRIEQEKRQDQFELEILQFQGYVSLDLAFKAAVQIMDIAYKFDKLDIKRAFYNAFEIYSMQLAFTQLVQKRGVQTMPTGSWFNQKSYNLTEKDLFFALKPEIQKLLRKKGVRYDK